MKTIIFALGLTSIVPAAPATWTPCGDGLLCATITVPVDWDRPSGPAIERQVVRLPATGERLGTLLTAPGGPGEDGAETLRRDAALYGPIREHYDVIGYQPRNSGTEELLPASAGPRPHDRAGPARPGDLGRPGEHAEGGRREGAAPTTRPG